MDSLKKMVLAWSKLATGGARPLAESVGIDRDFFARVLNNRRPLPDEDTTALATALGLASNGFIDAKIQSHLARHLRDLDEVLGLGFTMHCIAEIKSTREQRGGSPLQKYVAVLFSYGETKRLSVLRMARENWFPFTDRFGASNLPTQVLDTDVLPLLNALDTAIRPDRWARLGEAVAAGMTKEAAEVVRAVLDNQLDVPDELRGRIKAAQKLARKTELEKLSLKRSSLALWPNGAYDLARTHVLAPVTEEFAPANAIAVLRNGQRVFAALLTVTDDHPLSISDELIQAAEHLAVFLKLPWDSDTKHLLIFSGPAHLLRDKSTATGTTNVRYERSAKWLRDRQFDVPPELEIKPRADSESMDAVQ